MNEMVFKRITLLGGGKIGAGLAIRMAKRGCVVMIRERPEAMEKAQNDLKARLDQAVAKKKLKTGKRDEIVRLISWNDDYHHACCEFGPHILIDATTEDKGIKQAALAEAIKHLAEGVPKVTVTSALSVKELGFDAGFHPMSPPEINKGLELVIHDETPEELEEKLWQFAIQLGLVPIPVKANQSGYAVNGLFVPILLEACRMHEQGFGIPTIDKAFMAAAGIRVGAFFLMNFTGVAIAKLAAVPMQTLGNWMTIPQNLTDQIESGKDWDLSGEVDDSKVDELANRFRGLIFANAIRVVPDVHFGWHDLDRAIRICLAWPKGPAELMVDLDHDRVVELVQAYLDANPSFPKVEVIDDFDFDELSKTHWWQGILDQETGVAQLTLNCPEELGALSSDRLRELGEWIDELEGNGCRICLVQSEGGNFAGANIKEMDSIIQNMDDDDELTKHMTLGCEIFEKFKKSRIVFIGVISGKFVFGGGAELILSLDFSIAVNTAKFKFPEMVAVGCDPGWNGIRHMVEKSGRSKAATALFQPEYDFVGQEAVDAGFVNIVAPADKLEERLQKFIAGLLACAPQALAEQKRLLLFASDINENCPDQITDEITEAVGELLVTDEAKNRIAKFAGRKK